MLPRWARNLIDGTVVLAVVSGIFGAGQLFAEFRAMKKTIEDDQTEHAAARKSALATALRIQRLETMLRVSTPVEVDVAADTASEPQP